MQVFGLNSLESVNFFLHKHACLHNFPEIRGTENSGSGIPQKVRKHAGVKKNNF